MDKHLNKRLLSRGIIWSGIVTSLVVLTLVGLFTVKIAPFRAFGGAIWFKNGVHYFNNAQISKRIEKINAPKETAKAVEISRSTPSCNTIENGFCQRSHEDYAYKSLITPAVVYKPGTPDSREITGYCTLCNDGTFSPSCAVGRGACSYHLGVQDYNVVEYKTIAGTPAVPAKPAVYSYASKSYKDCPTYSTP